MVAPSSGTSQIEVEPYRHTPHSSYHMPQSNPSTPFDQTEPRTIPSQSAPSSSRLTSTSSNTSSTITAPTVLYSSSGNVASSSASTPNPSQTTVATDRSRTTPQSSSHNTPLAHVRHSSAVSSSAPTTASSSPSRHRRASSLQNTPPMAAAPAVHLRDIAHLMELARADDGNGTPGASSRRRQRFIDTRFEISQMPVADIIELVSALLTKITTTNDRNHENLHRNMPQPDSNGNLPEQATSVLAFHGKNVPTITIHSYLSRIHRYCPTTFEVFLSLLVYFDRMTERVNAGTVHQVSNLRPATPGSATVPPRDASSDAGDSGLGNFFVVDSYNIHRLVIAGVTCASKFFSDIFYTNSRYAKVGGLPLVELNHLELQFLTLNDFRLSIPVEELESYGNMLVQFYAREEMAKAAAQSGQDESIQD